MPKMFLNKTDGLTNWKQDAYKNKDYGHLSNARGL